MLLTRAPLYRGRSPFSCDLHVLGAPLTFVLSQDQTLQLDPEAGASGAKPPIAPPFSVRFCLRPSSERSRIFSAARDDVAMIREFYRGYEAQFSRTEGTLFPARGRGT